MMATNPMIDRPVGNGWGWLMAYGIVSLLVGIASFVFPVSATFAATVVVGLFILIAGGVSLASGLKGGAREGRGYAIALGIVAIIIGLILIFEPATGALSLTLLVVAWLLVRGGMELIWGVSHRTNRGWMIFLGIVNIVLALAVLATIGISAMTLPGYILGISFLLAGIAEIARAADHRRGAAAFATA